MKPKTEARLRTLLRRIDEWEDETEEGNSHPSLAEELILDIEQCLESILEDPANA